MERTLPPLGLRMLLSLCLPRIIMIRSDIERHLQAGLGLRPPSSLAPRVTLSKLFHPSEPLSLSNKKI